MRRGKVPEVGLLLLAYQLCGRIGLTAIPPVTLGLIGLQVGIYLQAVVVPRLCLSGEAVWLAGDWLRLVVPALRHTNDLHLYYNMVSLAWKGLALERRLGSARFLLTVSLLTLLSSAVYVLLAVLGSEVLEDYSIMRQCAIGFSGVLFALKVLNSHYSDDVEANQSFFGFPVPVRQAVWLELLIIQLVVPNSSFLGHLAGILAGLLYVKGPISSISSMLPSSPSSLLPSLTLLPASLLLSLLQVSLHLGLIPHLPPLTGCLPTRQHMTSHIRRLSLEQVQSLLVAPLHHLSTAHLAINLLSFLVKGHTLEKRLGFLRFVGTVLLSILGTSVTYIVLGRLWLEVTGSSSHLSHCTVGLSGPLFALKVVTIASSQRLDLTLLYEVAELAILVEKNNRPYHLCGLVAGLALLLLARWSQQTRFVGEGRRLGGDGRRGNGRAGDGTRHWTRSWGYSSRGEVGGMRGLTPCPSSPSAPPLEVGEVEHYSQPGAQPPYYTEQTLGQPGRLPPQYAGVPPPQYPGVPPPQYPGVPPPQYAPAGAPPPPGPGYRIATSSTSSTDDELRRRRMERFSCQSEREGSSLSSWSGSRSLSRSFIRSLSRSLSRFSRSFRDSEETLHDSLEEEEEEEERFVTPGPGTVIGDKVVHRSISEEEEEVELSPGRCFEKKDDEEKIDGEKY